MVLCDIECCFFLVSFMVGVNWMLLCDDDLCIVLVYYGFVI